MTTDYIIIGQGIAGSMLAWMLINEGKKVVVIDDEDLGSASRVASGIINPVTGKRLVKTWMADQIITFSKNTYGEIEKKFRIKIIQEKIITRIFSNPEDHTFFRQKSELDELPENVRYVNEFPKCFNDTKLGGIEINGVLQVNYSLLLKKNPELVSRTANVAIRKILSG